MKAELPSFTMGKFLALSAELQQRYLASTARELYERLRSGKEPLLWEAAYNEMALWLGAEPAPSSVKALADRYHQHLKAARRSHKERHLLPSIKKGDCLAGAEPWPFGVYLDNLRSAHNVGSIIRTMEALAFGKIYLSPATPGPENRQVQQTAMGAERWVECAVAETVQSLPRPLIAIETAEEAVPLHEFLFPLDGPITLILGNEEYGCSDESLQAADYLVQLPMRGRKNSLNVANMFALVAGELFRQKSLRG